MSRRPSLQARVDDYLAERRRQGFHLRSRDTFLSGFARFVAAKRHRGPLTAELMAEWVRAGKNGNGDTGTWASRWGRLRHFICYLQQFKPDTEVPEASLFGPERGRVAPHIYREEEVIDLLAAAHTLGPSGSLRPFTFETLFGLMASTGLRISEAIHLRDADVDLKRAMLTIRQTKFAKSRQLPIHPSTVKALARYRKQRERHLPTTPDMPFLISSRGRRLGLSLGERQAHRVFVSLRNSLRLINRSGRDAPRLHDLRHAFAVRRLMRWYADGTDVDQMMLALSTYLGHAEIFYTYWYLTAVPELIALAGGKFEQFADLVGDGDARRQPKPPPSFPALVQAFFAEHLSQQRALSPQTIAAYRDAFMLFLRFAETYLCRSPAKITLADITPEVIMGFLDHLERERHNSVRSRNARLAALRSFLKFAAHRDVSSLKVIEQALGVPAKRFERPMLGYLSREEMLAVIGMPDATWIGQRDHALLLLLYNTGARVSEIVGVKVGEVVLDAGAACVHLHGKGRKQRSVPLWRSAVRAIRAWLRRNPQFDSDSPLLPNRDGRPMSRWNVTQRLDRAVQVAAKSGPDLATRQISPHTIRHTTAMHLLQAGVDISVIALWLGHESPATTHQYVEADLAMKERALARLHEPEAKLRRYRAPDSLIDFLRAL